MDTAGRLHTKTGLMDELGKIKRVIEKRATVDEVLLVLDATTGQNGLRQARVFAEAVDVTGIVLTKLDGTAKGGIVIAVQRELGVPVKLVGLGEGPDDLAPFEPEAFVDAIWAERVFPGWGTVRVLAQGRVSGGWLWDSPRAPRDPVPAWRLWEQSSGRGPPTPRPEDRSRSPVAPLRLPHPTRPAPPGVLRLPRPRPHALRSHACARTLCARTPCARTLRARTALCSRACARAPCG